MFNYKFCLFLLSMMFFMSKPDEHRTQHSEYISLDKSHQQLKRVHEQQHENRLRDSELLLQMVV